MKNKKALSEIVGYVLLIAIALALAVGVFAWLKVFTQESTLQKCPDGVSLIIEDYSYFCSAGEINLTLENKGLFSLDGFYARGTDNAETQPTKLIGDEFGNLFKKQLRPGETTSLILKFNNLNLALVQIQPFIDNTKGRAVCESVVNQKITCK